MKYTALLYGVNNKLLGTTEVETAALYADAVTFRGRFFVRVEWAGPLHRGVSYREMLPVSLPSVRPEPGVEL